MQTSDEPRIGITMGDPAGVGPELIARALHADGDAGVTIFGDRRVLDAAAARAKVPAPRNVIEVTALTVVDYPAIVADENLPTIGAAAVAYLEAAVAVAREGRIDAFVTAPINKFVCKMAGFAFPGHTEFLAERLGVPEVAMMIAGPHLRVVPATTHIALTAVPAALPTALPPAIAITVTALHDDFGIEWPAVAVCGLNPHAGERGHFGDEETRIITPAIDAARARLGDRFPFHLSGPHVPDAVFRAAAAPPVGEGRYHAVVGCYHDQALIPVKLIDFDDAVNVTLGLPIPRTSPDHGVAYDAAASGKARDGSFRAALRLARDLARRRRNGARPA